MRWRFQASAMAGVQDGARGRRGFLKPHDDHAVYCSFLETNFVYLWEGYVLHSERCDKISGLNPSRGLCPDSHLSGPRLC